MQVPVCPGRFQNCLTHSPTPMLRPQVSLCFAGSAQKPRAAWGAGPAAQPPPPGRRPSNQPLRQSAPLVTVPQQASTLLDLYMTFRVLALWLEAAALLVLWCFSLYARAPIWAFARDHAV